MLVAAGFVALVAVVLVIGLVVAVGLRRAGDGDRVVTGPLDGRREATLELLDGAASITVRAADLGDRLYRVSTPDGSNLRPRVDDRAGVVGVQIVEMPDEPPGASAVEVRLHPDVRWTLRLLGGATAEVVDLAGGRVAGLEVVGGVSRLEVALPPPTGAVALRLDGGAGQVSVRVPDGVPVRVRAGGGAGVVSIDGTVHNGVAAGREFTPPGWAAAPDRYDVVAGAGVGTLTVDRP